MENSTPKPARRRLPTVFGVIVVLVLLGLGDEQQRHQRQIHALEDQVRKLEKELGDLDRVAKSGLRQKELDLVEQQRKHKRQVGALRDQFQDLEDKSRDANSAVEPGGLRQQPLFPSTESNSTDRREMEHFARSISPPSLPAL